MNTTKTNVKLTKKDILKLIDKISDKKNCQATIFIGEYGTTLTITPYEEHPDEWIIVPGCTKVICPKCGRESDAMVPYCQWCGNENGVDKDKMKDALERQSRFRRSGRYSLGRKEATTEEEKKDDQT